MADPVTLELTPRKPRVVLNEGVILDLKVEVTANVEMDSPELNDGPTTVVLTHLDELDGDKPRVTRLTGRDHRALFRIDAQTPIANAWKMAPSQPYLGLIELCHYRRPLPAGRYTVQVVYAFPDGRQIRSNTAQIEVAVAKVGEAAFRWFGENRPRKTLGIVWAVQDDADERCLYQIATRHDPGVLHCSVVVPAPTRPQLPRLAHLNHMGSFHFTRVLVWAGDHLNWMQVGPQGAVEKPNKTDHTLDGEVAVVPPALQRQQRGVNVLLRGESVGEPALAVVVIDWEGLSERPSVAYDALYYAVSCQHAAPAAVT